MSLIELFPESALEGDRDQGQRRTEGEERLQREGEPSASIVPRPEDPRGKAGGRLTTEVKESVSEAEVSLYRAVPAWIAAMLGGATPEKQPDQRRGEATDGGGAVEP